jgi:hypothetical protein
VLFVNAHCQGMLKTMWVSTCKVMSLSCCDSSLAPLRLLTAAHHFLLVRLRHTLQHKLDSAVIPAVCFHEGVPAGLGGWLSYESVDLTCLHQAFPTAHSSLQSSVVLYHLDTRLAIVHNCNSCLIILHDSKPWTP